MSRLVNLTTQGNSINSKVRPGQKMYTFAEGTTTPLATYTDIELTIPHANPVISDSTGAFPEVFLQEVGYKIRFTDKHDVQYDEIDNVFGVRSSGNFSASVSESFTSSAGQTAFVLTQSTYQPGKNQLLVYVNGVFQTVITNFLETNTTTITFTAPLELGDFVSVVNSVPVNIGVDLQITSAVGGTESETFSSAAGQTVFLLTESTYNPGDDALQVYVNGVFQTVTLNYTESSPSSITFTAPLVLNDVVTVVNIIPTTNVDQAVFSVPVTLPNYTVALLPTINITSGAMAYATDETGGAVPVFYDGASWRRTTDRTVAS